MPTQEPSTAPLLEVLFFSSGLKSKLYGAERRPDWLPAVDRIGLQNDVYLAPGQHVIDFSRLCRTDGGGGVGWIGIYAYGKDLYGDRGNFCGVGVWLIDGLVLDHRRLLQVLDALLIPLNGASPPSDPAEIEQRVGDGCRKALGYLAAGVLGRAAPDVGLGFAGSFDTDSRHICFDETWSVDSDLHRLLAEIFDALTLAEIKLKPVRLLFVCGRDVRFDSRADPGRRSAGLAGLLGPTRLASQVIRNQLAKAAALEQRAHELAHQLSEAQIREARIAGEQAQLRGELDQVRQQLERYIAAEVEQQRGVETQERLSELFWERVEERIGRVVAAYRPREPAPPQAFEPKSTLPDAARLQRLLGSIEEKLPRVEAALMRSRKLATAEREATARTDDAAEDSPLIATALASVYRHRLVLGLLAMLLLILILLLGWLLDRPGGTPRDSLDGNAAAQQATRTVRPP